MSEVPFGVLTGRVVVVTGGNKGIGLGIAKAVADAGAAVAIWGRDEERNTAARSELEALGATAASFRCDVADEDQVIGAMAQTVNALGQVDALVANAGTSGASPFTSMSLDSWRSMMAVNLDGAFLCLREAARHMVDRGEGGSLLAISSLTAVDGAPGVVHYAASKAALLALMRGLAVELARHRIRCNAIMPGWIATDLNEEARKNERFLDVTTARTPVRRWGTPADIGATAVYLCDPGNLFHTGDTLTVDGGYSIF
jgi:NAD(P)-dependent dehydrogenase (short-subunit alcohol dehydrogenase family)